MMNFIENCENVVSYLDGLPNELKELTGRDSENYLFFFIYGFTIYIFYIIFHNERN